MSNPSETAICADKSALALCAVWLLSQSCGGNHTPRLSWTVDQTTHDFCSFSNKQIVYPKVQQRIMLKMGMFCHILKHRNGGASLLHFDLLHVLLLLSFICESVNGWNGSEKFWNIPTLRQWRCVMEGYQWPLVFPLRKRKHRDLRVWTVGAFDAVPWKALH